MVYIQSKTAWCFPFWKFQERGYNSLLIVSAFSFLSSRAITSSRKWRLMTSMIVGVARANFKLCSHRITGARCSIWHVPRNSTRIHVLTLLQLKCGHCHIYETSGCQSWAFTFGCAKSQKLARNREIAKFNTCKIVGIQKSQNFVLANNSNNGVW